MKCKSMGFVHRAVTPSPNFRRGRDSRTCTRASSDLPSLPSSFLEASESFRNLSGKSQVLKLVELGDRLGHRTQNSPSPPQLYEESNRVRGCTSIVYVHAFVEPGSEKVHVCGDADAKVVRGLLWYLLEAIDGKLSRDEVLALRSPSIISETNLREPSLASRFFGLGRILETIQNQLRPAQSEASQRTVRGPSSVGEDVAVLLSGGVDSSVALRLLLDQGYRPRPFYLKVWLEDELAHLGQCPWEEDIAFAEEVCRQVGIPLQVISFQREYWDQVVQYTIEEASSGRTPNPDMMCNSRIKYGVFYDQIGREFSLVASGHYAQTKWNENFRCVDLLCSADGWKDQTYFLSHLRQDQVSKAIFPVGSKEKSEVRRLAESYQLPNRGRRDSQGICFLGKLRFDSFLEHHLGKRPGPLVELETQTQVGIHRGFWFYTLGQRKGLGLSGGPWYVTAKNAEENVVYVSRNYHEEKPRNRFSVESISWIRGFPPSKTEQGSLRVKIRHGPAFLDILGMELVRSDRAIVQISQNTHGLAPGQFAAFYHRDICLGSGVIASDLGQRPIPSEIRSASSVKLQAHHFPDPSKNGVSMSLDAP